MELACLYGCACLEQIHKLLSSKLLMSFAFGDTGNMTLDKDKLILVVYFGTDGLLLSRAYTEMVRCRESLISQFDYSVKILVIPDRTSEEIRVEPINPQLISDEDYKSKILPLVEKAEQVLKEFKYENQ